jgi:hypothetical protein
MRTRIASPTPLIVVLCSLSLFFVLLSKSALVPKEIVQLKSKNKVQRTKHKTKTHL